MTWHFWPLLKIIISWLLALSFDLLLFHYSTLKILSAAVIQLSKKNILIVINKITSTLVCNACAWPCLILPCWSVRTFKYVLLAFELEARIFLPVIQSVPYCVAYLCKELSFIRWASLHFYSCIYIYKLRFYLKQFKWMGIFM